MTLIPHSRASTSRMPAHVHFLRKLTIIRMPTEKGPRRYHTYGQSPAARYTTAMDQGSSSTSNSTCCFGQMAMAQIRPRQTQKTARHRKEGRVYGVARSSRLYANKIAQLRSSLHLHRTSSRATDCLPRQLLHALLSLCDDILWPCVCIYFISIVFSLPFFRVFCISPCIHSSTCSRIATFCHVLSRIVPWYS